ncbi:MAG: DNA polymerase/3'-5' exonuclease PolX [Actinobacteria bacterium]|nr:DNA polymerase/3'-5' exonuclease PolX [Actinomycetota bacterium]
MAATLPRNAQVAEQFDLLADLLELEGEEQFRVIAYRRAADLIRSAAGPIARLALDGEAKKLPGIGKTIESKIVQIVDSGEIEALTKRKARIPSGVAEFLRLPALGPKTARRIWQELGITTVADLKRAAEAERLRTLPGLGAKTEERILRALAEKPQEKRTLLAAALPAVQAVVDVLREHPASTQVSEAGSVRRRTETVRDLDIIATASDPAALTDYLTKLRWVSEVEAHGKTKATVVSHDGLRFDLRVVPPDSYGNLLQHFTGSKRHNVALREDAVRRGLSVSEYGVKDVESGEVFTAVSEEELYERLGYQWIPPELREGAGELEAARRGELPKLVEVGDLRGDLHMHSTWSNDGKNTLEEMVHAARDRGYDYVAVTDHAHYLREGRFQAQWDEIAELAPRLEPFRILRGVEVSIRADGSVDMSDDDLAGCDWVMASLHSAFDKSPTERVLSAMENPHVDCLGHLTARKLNRRGGADLALDRVFEKAVDTGTLIEINSQPDRLDLRDVHARAAAEAGVQLVISTDSHELGALAYMELGVAQARRAWLTKKQVANTRTWRQLLKLKKP